MKSAIAILIILLDCLLAWMVSGSPLPLGQSFLLALVWLAGAVILRRNSFLLSFSVAAVFGCIQFYLFQTEQAFVVNLDLPGLFHVGMVFHWFFYLDGLASNKEDESGSGRTSFWMGLVGSAIIFWSIAPLEIIEYPMWMICLISILPFFLIIGSEIIPRRRAGLISLFAVGLFSLVLGQVSVFSQFGVSRFYEFLQKDAAEDSFDDERNRSAEQSDRTGPGSDSREIAMRADISFKHKVRFYTQADDSETFQNWISNPIYARTSTLVKFEGNNKMTPLRKGKWFYDGDDGNEDASTSISSTQVGKTYLYSMLINRSDLTQLPTLLGTRRIGAESVYEFAEGWYQLSVEEEIEWLRYRGEADWKYSIFPEGETSWVTSSIFPAPPESPYLSLPATPLGERIKEQTNSLLRNVPPEKHPQTIAGFIRGNCQYSLRYENPESLPPIENFLFSERKGHCELFASATVLMLRSAGIPSRIAYGYAGGQSDPKAQMIAFRDSDFHSWAEILLADGHTWAVFDTTPIVSDSARRPPVNANLSGLDLNRYEDIGKVEYVPVLEGISLGGRLDDILDWMSLHFLQLLLTIPVLGSLVWLFRQWRSRWGRSNSINPAGKIALPDASSKINPSFLDAILELGNSYGYQKRKGQTLAEFVDYLRSNGVGSPDLFEAVDYVYRIRYTGRERNSAEEKNYLRSIRKLISAAS